MYTGWTLYDKVKLVIRTKCYYGYEYPQAYLVDPKNSKQLNLAINWAKGYGDIEPKIIETANCGFKLTIIDSASSSSQGGKLSFWNCLIEKDSENIKCIIGIDSALLLKLIKSTSFFNGECAEELSFARCQGGVGMLSYKMKEYKDAIEDMKAKKDITTKKTSKWRVGCNYKTLTINSLYLGGVTRLLDLRWIHNDYARVCNRYTYEANLIKNGKQHICCNTEIDCNNITKLSQLINRWEDNINNNYVKALDSIYNKGSSGLHIGDLISSAPIFEKYNIVNNLPARQQGDIKLEIDVDIEKEYTRIIELMQDKVIDIAYKAQGKINMEYYIDSLMIRAGHTDINELTDRELKLLSLLEHSNVVDVSKIGLSNRHKIEDNKGLIEDTEELLEKSKNILSKLKEKN